MRKIPYAQLFLVSVLLGGCSHIETPRYEGPARAFESSFESLDDFTDFFIVPPGDYASSHELSSERAHEGLLSHKAWILEAREDDNDGLVYKPHRAYPTIQLHKTLEGSYRSPCLVSLWVYLDMELADRSPGIDDWFSFITLSPDSSDSWTRTVLVNLDPEGYLKLVHVPRQGEQERIFQVDAASDPSGSQLFPYRTWVRLDVYIDLDADEGYAKLWQNGSLLSHALVEGGRGALAQAHFGMYAAAAVEAGSVYNDSLRIVEIGSEAEALELMAR